MGADLSASPARATATVQAAAGVRLRPLTADDGDVIVRWRNDPIVASQMFAPPPASADAHRRWFAGMEARGDREEFVVVAGGRPVGTIGLSDVDRVHRRAQYGIVIGEADARGKGIARGASVLILDRAFGALALHRVYLNVYADNAPALGLYRRLGFVEEGVLRQHAMRDGAPRDVVVMGLLQREWTSRP